MDRAYGNHYGRLPGNDRIPSMAERFLAYVKQLSSYLS